MNAKLQDLPVEERIKVVEDLWDSIAVDQKALPFTAAQKTELDRRLDAADSGLAVSRPWDEVRARLRDEANKMQNVA